jgi:hypothetical protein
MQTQYNEIINSFVDKYGLSRDKVVAEIEKIFSEMLSRWYGTNTIVLFGLDHLQAIRYINGGGVTCQDQLELISMNGWNTIRRMIDKNLSRAACLHEVNHYKRHEHEMRWGEILRKNNDGLLVELELEKDIPVLAQCPWNRIGVHEQKELSVGQNRAFHLRRIEPLLLHGISRFHVAIDRVSKNLVIGLLRDQLDCQADLRLYCPKRYVGHKSFVEANRFIPKKIIKAVSQELQEHIQVTVEASK